MRADSDPAVLGGRIHLIDADGQRTGGICDYPLDSRSTLSKLIVMSSLNHP